MNQRLLALGSVVALVVLVIIVVVWRHSTSPTAHVPSAGAAVVGQKAPEFQAATTAGPLDLAQTHAPVMLEIFATWCPHCQRETAVIDQVYKKYKDRVDFLAVNGSDTAADGESPENQMDVLTFQTKYHMQYPVAYDPQLRIAKLYLQGGFPTIAVINTKKIVTYLDSGELSASALEAAIQKALK